MPIKEPQSPIEVPRRFRLHRHQMIGLTLIFLIPVLTLFKVFGNTSASHTLRTPDTEVTIEYPTKQRYKEPASLRVKVTNLSSIVRDTISVVMDTAYLSSFSGLSIVPEPEQAYRVTFTNLAPNEKREIIAEMEGFEYGWQQGTIEVTSKRDTLRDSIRTYIFW